MRSRWEHTMSAILPVLILCLCEGAFSESKRTPLITPLAEYNFTIAEQTNQVPASPIVIQLQIQLREMRRNKPESNTQHDFEAEFSSATGGVSETRPEKAEYFIIGFDDGTKTNYTELESCETCTIYDINDVYMTIQKTIPESGPFKPRAECTVSVSDITSILETITKFTKGELENQHSDVMNATNMNECQEALRDTRNTVQQLIELYKKIKAHDANSVSAQDYQKTVNDYNTQIKRFYEHIAFLEKQVEDTARTKLDELNTVHQKFTQNFAQIQAKLEREISARQDELVQLIGLQMQVGKFQDAADSFNTKLHDRKRIGEIVRAGYKIESVPNFIMFLQQYIGSQEYVLRTAALSALVDMITEKKNNESPNMILLDNYIETLWNYNSNSYSNLNALLAKTRPAVGQILINWAHNIQRGQYAAVQTFLNSKGEMMNNYLAKLCKIIVPDSADQFSNPGDKITIAEKLVDFSKGLERSHRAVVRTEMFKILFEQNGRTTVSKPLNHVALQIATIEYRENGEKSRWWKDVPRPWKSIIRGKRQCIWHSLEVYQVIVPGNLNDDRGKVHATSWNSHSEGKGDVISTDWYFETIDDGKTWRIKDEAYGDYLYAEWDNKLDGERRPVSVWRNHRPQPRGYFKLETAKSTHKWANNRWLFLNTEVDEYLAMDMHEDYNTWYWLGTRPIFTYHSSQKRSFSPDGHYHEFTFKDC